MLDVHPPHHPTHTWKDFFIHIATIVVGLLIAVGLEQAVEFFHHRHQAHALEEALDGETRSNLRILDRSIAILEEVHASAELNKAALETHASTKGRPPLLYTDFDPSTEWTFPTNATWAAARDNGTLALLPPTRARSLSRIDGSVATVIETSHQMFDARYRMLALVHLHPTPELLSAEERARLLLALSDYEEVADHTAMVMRKSKGALAGAQGAE